MCFHYPGHSYFHFSPVVKPHNTSSHEVMTKSSNSLACFSPSILLSSFWCVLTKQFCYDEWQPNFSTTIRSKGQVQKYLLTLTSQTDMLPRLRPMCVFLYYTSQKYNLTTSRRYSWRDLSTPVREYYRKKLCTKVWYVNAAYPLQHRAGQLDLEQWSGEGGLLYLRTDKKHWNDPLLLVLLGSHTVQLKAVIPYCNCFEEPHLHKNCSLVLPFCKDDMSKYDSGTSLESGFKKKKSDFFSVCNVTINN